MPCSHGHYKLHRPFTIALAYAIAWAQLTRLRSSRRPAASEEREGSTSHHFPRSTVSSCFPFFWLVNFPKIPANLMCAEFSDNSSENLGGVDFPFFGERFSNGICTCIVSRDTRRNESNEAGPAPKLDRLGATDDLFTNSTPTSSVPSDRLGCLTHQALAALAILAAEHQT
jgi:hypothetical protein